MYLSNKYFGRYKKNRWKGGKHENDINTFWENIKRKIGAGKKKNKRIK